MRVRPLSAALLLLITAFIPKVTSEDIYWEGDNDAANEFLEVDSANLGIGGHLRRLTRELFSPSNSSNDDDEDFGYDKDDDDDVDVGEDTLSESDGGSGLPDRIEPELKEKTLRVTFVVTEPYQMTYSNRDSLEFQNFSKSLAEAVNLILRDKPGTHRASLVRIQSRPTDEFSCKVTLEIITNGYDTNKLANILRDHISERMKLGAYTVNEDDFSATVIDPAYNSPLDSICAADEFKCNDAQCVQASARCNKEVDCSDGSDEIDCPIERGDAPEQPIESVTEYPSIYEEGTNSPTEAIPESETDDPDNTIIDECPEDFLRCDNTRCISTAQICDGINNCDDGADETGCPDKSCGEDDFRCNNGKCIDGSQRCDRVVNCPTEEDEHDCECAADEFRCQDVGYCIDGRKRCDGISHCRDGSDEYDCDWSGDHVCKDEGMFLCKNRNCISILLRCDGFKDCRDGSDEINCPCRSNHWQCDNGNCIKRSQRCDGRVDCPTDRSDERNCIASGYYRCRGGKLIHESERCNRRYDCDPGDYSDEQNCPCGDGDFKCDNGYCIPRSKHCDRTHDCQDGSDERDCTYGSVCMAYQYMCTNGVCVKADSRCNGTVECDDGSDEDNCPCKRDQFQCRDGSCINIALRCNGHKDCHHGEDESNCNPRCPADSFTCDPDSTIRCAKRCNGVQECDQGEDEDGCQDCHECDGRCLEDEKICDKVADCSDGSDEANCNDCEDVSDFRCSNGECIDIAQRCNGIAECTDSSDESECNETMITGPNDCNENQFRCRNGECVNYDFKCDGNQDCNDNSDEENCSCQSDEWQCSYTRLCIPVSKHCNGINDCNDGSDEYDCPTTYRPFTYPVYNQQPQMTTQQPTFTTASVPFLPPHYVPENRGPVALNLKAYPTEQIVRNGGDVVFMCRDEGPLKAPVRWVREGGRPLKSGTTDRRGRLEMFKVSSADEGTYICQAPRYLGTPGAELRVVLKVEKKEIQSVGQFFACPTHQATCANGECIPKSALCDGHIDCSDRSDEDACNVNGKCEPNQFECANHRCILKTWRCDSFDDCQDNSDEQNCGVQQPGEQCLPIEFACSTKNQCIPKSFHCDGEDDCFDRSDEIGCGPVYILRPPAPSNVRLNPGETLTLVCEATGIPTPLVTWRLNWGHVPAKCRSTSHNGVGTLTCPDMQTQDSGAYSCEAISNKGTAFASPDSIVYVNRTEALCPPGYFNSEARSQNECIQCFCFGESTSCKSADLFIYNMPTPLGEGGTRLVGVIQSPNGEVTLDKHSINEQYYEEPLRNGARVTKIERSSSSSGAHPYITLPESYNGNQLTSYGGHIKYRLSPQTLQRYNYNDNLADIIIMGKYQSLVHRYNRGDQSRDVYNVEARLTPNYWMKNSPGGLVPASREDIMMALDDVEMILLRADFYDAGVNITDFSMESAQHINVGLGSANLVEECSCPPGYEGLSCQKCSSGYVRQRSGSWLGSCILKRPCPPGTYGDPNSGGDCRACPCPLTNRENQFARTCALGPNGDVICDCMPGYEGIDCSHCAPNYYGNPLIPGDSCKLKPSDNCNAVGTAHVRPPDECVCKDNVEGRFCEKCKGGSFFLSSDFRYGCASCFCSGVSQECMSSNLRRKTTRVRFNVPQIVDQVKIFKSEPFGAVGAVRYNAPIETDVLPELYRGEVTLGSFDRSKPAIYYWSLPVSFAGDKVTSYGGYLNYVLGNVPSSGSQGSRNNAPDVQLISENRLTFNYFGDFVPESDGYLNATIQFLEKGWQRPDGKDVSREIFLLALADVKNILVKATYSTNDVISSIVSASIDTAENGAYGPMAQHVEQCNCSAEYVGTSCEDCAPGYTRGSRGLYLKPCEPCNCNGKSAMCNPETGECLFCGDNTAGPNCELCKDGYEKDYYNNCVLRNPTTQLICDCDPRGEEIPCDSYGRCTCKQNVEGDRCDRCRDGTFGLDSANPLGCLSCYCSGVTNNCHETNHFNRIPIAAPIFGEDFGGYALMDINGEDIVKDAYFPVPNESELMYIFPSPFQLIKELYWSLPVFPGNRILSYGGTLSVTQKFQTGGYPEQSSPGTDVVFIGDDVSVYWSNPMAIRSDEALSYQVPLQEQGWFILNTPKPASRSEFMSVLKNLQRVLVRATLTPNVTTTAIADVSMDTATESYDKSLPIAKGVEVCMCPAGYTGTSCENCAMGYYKDQDGYCRQCNCNGHDCQLNVYNEVICNCRPPYTGPDCSTVGLIMELHPRIHDNHAKFNLVDVTFTCKYRAPEPLTIRFFHGANEIHPAKLYNESKLYIDGWRGEHSWKTMWDKKLKVDVYECRTITKAGFTLGVLTTTLPEKGGEKIVGERTTRQPPLESNVVVRITSPTIKIQEVGSTVNFICKAQSRMVQKPLQVNWSKADGNLPQDRTYINSRTGELIISNLQISDSGVYICQTSDGISTDQATATLKVPGNDMTLPTVSINPQVKDYYEGDVIELNCDATGNPTPRITWQRALNKPLPLDSRGYGSTFVIDRARVEDTGEYRCIASNSAGSTDKIAVITVRPRPSWPSQEQLKVSSSAPNLNEGQSTQVICTGPSNIPSGAIHWVRQDGTDFTSNVHSDNGILYIDYAQLENNGIYICQSTFPDVNPKLITVTVIPLGTPSPEETSNITVSVKQLTIPTGKSGTIDCIPQGYPLPVVKWTKHQDTFGPGTSQRDTTLIINNAQDSDQGYYLCEATVRGVRVESVYVYVEIEKREAPKVEIYPAGETSVTLDSQFEIQCRVIGGIPSPVVTWDKNRGSQLATHVQILQNNVLSFQTVDVNDEGIYTCTATNEVGSSSASSIVKVRSPPKITITPTSYIESRPGDQLRIECRADGYPDPMVSIKSNNDIRVLIRPSPRIAVFSIPNVNESDEGDYICVATSVAGTVEEQFRIVVDRGDGGFGEFEGSAENEFDPGYPNDNIDRQTNNIVGIEGQISRIGCDAPNEFQVQWARNDRLPLQYNARQVGSELIITNTSKSDAGTYECRLINRLTHDIQLSASTNLIVMAAPKITLRPPTQTVQPGQSPIVECLVEGDDITSISWKPVNRFPSSRVEIHGSTLIFRQIEVEDAGEYKCFATNRVANATAIAEVKVSAETERTPSETHDNEQFAHVGAAVHLSCNVTQRNLRIRWTKDGRALLRSISQKNDGSLFIKLAQKSDSGRYVCIISDGYGRQTSNYINLHIEGFECLVTQFRCYDDSGCINDDLLCDGYDNCQDGSDENNCILREKRVLHSPMDRRTDYGNREEVPSFVYIENPRKSFRVGERVEVLCKANRDIKVSWERYGTKQFVNTRTYGDGAVLLVPNVGMSDAGVYRCIGRDLYGRTSTDDFNLEVVPVSDTQSYPINDAETVYKARLDDTIDLPCKHNLEEPVSVEWRREFGQLPPNVSPYERTLHIDRVSEADAGTYICQVRNNRVRIETRATLRVVGIIPMFNGDGWIALPKLKDAYTQFEIEISFKPADSNGIILYNGQNEDGTGDYLVLELIDGVPQFTLKFDTSDALVIQGDRPLTLNTWHTIRLRRSGSKVVMDVDNNGPFRPKSTIQYQNILDLYAPLYIGNAPPNRPESLLDASGFVGCVSMLILGKEEKNIMADSESRYKVNDCESCSPNLCLYNGVCQEARNERGYMCLCAAGYSGQNCDRVGEACRPGLCGPGKCSDTADGYTCACPVTFTGKNCDVKQNIEYPAFTGSAYLAIKSPKTFRYLRMTMKIKAKPPVTDSIIMYCAQSPRGDGGFTALTVRNGHLEYIYDLDDGSGDSIVLTSNKTLLPNEWTSVHIGRSGAIVSLDVDDSRYTAKLQSPEDLNLGTPLYVGGVDDSIILNNNTGVTGGFSGCIKDVTFQGGQLNLINSSILSANIQECVNYDRGDIPEFESVCSQCQNGGSCLRPDSTSCLCRPGFTGTYCENRAPLPSQRRPLGDPCSAQPCKNDGKCKMDRSTRMNYTCNCPLGFAGDNCQIPLQLYQSVGFNGNGYLELPARLFRYDELDIEPAVFAIGFHTNNDGVLMYQREGQLSRGGDFVLIRIVNGIAQIEWDLGTGINHLSIDDVIVTDGESHSLIAKLFSDNRVEFQVDSVSRSVMTSGFMNVMNADTNIYIGGLPERLSSEIEYYSGFIGCIQQIEFNGASRGLDLGRTAVAGRNTQRCKE